MKKKSNKFQKLNKYLLIHLFTFCHLVVGVIFYWLLAAPFAIKSGNILLFHLITPLILIFGSTVTSKLSNNIIVFTCLSVLVSSYLWVVCLILISYNDRFILIQNNVLGTMLDFLGFALYILLVFSPALILGGLIQILCICLCRYLLNKYFQS